MCWHWASSTAASRNMCVQHSHLSGDVVHETNCIPAFLVVLWTEAHGHRGTAAFARHTHESTRTQVHARKYTQPQTKTQTSKLMCPMMPFASLPFMLSSAAPAMDLLWAGPMLEGLDTGAMSSSKSSVPSGNNRQQQTSLAATADSICATRPSVAGAHNRRPHPHQITIKPFHITTKPYHITTKPYHITIKPHQTTIRQPAATTDSSGGRSDGTEGLLL